MSFSQVRGTSLPEVGRYAVNEENVLYLWYRDSRTVGVAEASCLARYIASGSKLKTLRLESNRPALVT